MKGEMPIRFNLSPLPSDDSEAVQWLLDLVRLEGRDSIRQVPDNQFKQAWYSISFLYPGLHPDDAVEHGTEISNRDETSPEIIKQEPRLHGPYYVESGWPVVLEPFVAEAWRRYEAGALEEDEFYCYEASIAGMCRRSPEFAEDIRMGQL